MSDYLEQYSKFIRDNDYKIKKIEQDIQNQLEKSYDTTGKIGI